VHPRNRHRDGYDFAALVRTSPALAAHVIRAPHGGASIDFAQPAAVKALNRALLAHDYGVRDWDIPPGYLCPPVPGRADYLHHLADLLATDHGGVVPRGRDIVILDLGTGANVIYPLLGQHDYGWCFVGSEVDPVALRNAQTIVQSNPALAGVVQLRRQSSSRAILTGVVGESDRFAASICNPPFHVSATAAARGTQRKVRNLTGGAPRVLPLNFGGTSRELWCPGGELAFIRRLIAESADFGGQFGWFTTLVSKSAHLPALRASLAQVRARDVRTIDMAQGQKQSRLLAWRFARS
jgi:23S rRNA (adenine1618-N6)-methyltransferase